ncbi:unnamed protein product, partial [Didymodactylos carnosus]
MLFVTIDDEEMEIGSSKMFIDNGHAANGPQ